MSRRIRSWAIATGGATLMLTLTGFVVVPGYVSPVNRLYNSPLGYPAMLRLLGRPIPVRTEVARRARLTEVVMGQGFIDPEEIVNVSARASARVLKVAVDVGSPVEAGQVLIVLEATEMENRYRTAAANLQVAEVNLSALKAGARAEAVREKEISVDRAKKDMQVALEQYVREKRLLEQGVSAKADVESYERSYHNAEADYLAAVEALAMAKTARPEDLQAAEARVDSARSELATRKKELDETQIRCPSAGIVIGRSVNPGEVTRGPGETLLSIARGFAFNAGVDQEKTGQVRPGLRAEVQLGSFPGRVFPGKVTKVNPAIQTLGKTWSRSQGVPATFPVWIALESIQEPLAPGLQGFARILMEREALAIPTGSLMHFSGGEGLTFVVQGDRTVLRAVRFGITSDGMSEILSGLSEGDRVIIEGQQALQPGDLARVEEVE